MDEREFDPDDPIDPEIRELFEEESERSGSASADDNRTQEEKQWGVWDQDAQTEELLKRRLTSD